jgi:hypothetical protein
LKLISNFDTISYGLENGKNKIMIRVNKSKTRVIAVSLLAVLASFMVVPSASAAVTTLTATVTSSTSTIYIPVGSEATADIKLTTTNSETGTGSIVLTPTITTNAGTATIGTPASNVAGLKTPETTTATLAASATANKWTNTITSGVETLNRATSSSVAALSAVKVSTFSFTPTTAGTYVFAITPTGALNTNTAVSITVIATQPRLDNLSAITAGTTTVTQGETGTATLSASFIASAAGETLTVKAGYTAAAGSANLRFSTVDSTTGTLVVNGAEGTAPQSEILASAAGVVGATLKINFISTTATAAGTYTVSIYTSTVGGGTLVAVPQSVTFTVKAADTLATGASTSTLANGTTSASAVLTEAIDSTVVASKLTTATQAANIYVRQKNSTSTANESFTAVVSGPAYVTSGSSASGSRPTSGSGITVKNGDFVHVWSTGTAGKATITLTSMSGVVLGTETVIFYGAVTKIAQTQAPVKSIARAGGYSTSSAFTISATDANNNPVPGLTITGTSSDVNVIGSVTVAEDSTTPGDYLVSYTSSASSKSGNKATITFKTVDPAITTTTAYLTTTADVTVGGSVAKEVITLDKSTYAPGEQMIVTITATDASGNPVYDGAAVPSLSANKTVVGLDLRSSTYLGGKSDTQARYLGVVTNAYRAFAPATAGSFTITATSGNATADNLSVSATVADAAMDAATDAANEATDAANAATDAALAAADAADAATAAAQDASDAVAALSAEVSKMIASLKAQITSLTNLVIKIQKKVRA